jgi:hypothetical protein
MNRRRPLLVSKQLALRDYLLWQKTHSEPR